MLAPRRPVAGPLAGGRDLRPAPSPRVPGRGRTPPGAPEPETFVDAFWLSFGIVLLAELGDKSQLMALAFAARYPGLDRPGRGHDRDPHRPRVVGPAGRGARPGPPDERHQRRRRARLLRLRRLDAARRPPRGEATSRGPRDRRAGRCVTIGTAFFLAELGDKTMLATITLATTEEPIGDWLGSTAGMVAADALAIGVGALLGSRLPERAIKVFAAGRLRGVRRDPRPAGPRRPLRLPVAAGAAAPQREQLADEGDQREERREADEQRGPSGRAGA